MEKKKSGFKLYYLLFIATALVLMVVATMSDYDINASINNTSSGFGNFLADYGEMPLFLFLPFATAVLFSALEKGAKAYLVKKILAAVFHFVALVYFFSRFIMGEIENETMQYVLGIVFGLVGGALCLFLFSKISPETLKKLKPFAIYAILGILCVALSTELMKNIWGRMRFRDLLKTADPAGNFTAWYLPQFFTGDKSFPSGHTSAASSTLLLMALPDVFKKLKKYEILFFLFAFAFTFMVGYSRMIVGAHFLSDITIGASLGMLFYGLLRQVYLAKRVEN